MNIISQIENLRQLTYELLNLGMDGSPIYSDYSDRFVRLNKDVLIQSDTLFLLKSRSTLEEAYLCLALLNGYSATIYDCGDKERKKQVILDRFWEILDQLPASLLKCQILIACYAEVFDENLAQEVHAIINSWGHRELSEDEKEIIRNLRELEKKQYPNSEIIE